MTMDANIPEMIAIAIAPWKAMVEAHRRQPPQLTGPIGTRRFGNTLSRADFVLRRWEQGKDGLGIPGPQLREADYQNTPEFDRGALLRLETTSLLRQRADAALDGPAEDDPRGFLRSTLRWSTVESPTLRLPLPADAGSALLYGYMQELIVARVDGMDRDFGTRVGEALRPSLVAHGTIPSPEQLLNLNRAWTLATVASAADWLVLTLGNGNLAEAINALPQVAFQPLNGKNAALKMTIPTASNLAIGDKTVPGLRFELQASPMIGHILRERNHAWDAVAPGSRDSRVKINMKHLDRNPGLLAAHLYVAVLVEHLARLSVFDPLMNTSALIDRSHLPPTLREVRAGQIPTVSALVRWYDDGQRPLGQGLHYFVDTAAAPVQTRVAATVNTSTDIRYLPTTRLHVAPAPAGREDALVTVRLPWRDVNGLLSTMANEAIWMDTALIARYQGQWCALEIGAESIDEEKEDVAALVWDRLEHPELPIERLRHALANPRRSSWLYRRAGQGAFLTGFVDLDQDA